MFLVEIRIPSPRLETPDGGSGLRDGKARFGEVTEGYNGSIDQAQGGVGVGFDPDESQRYLEGVDYPASKETLLSVAQENGAPDELVELIAGAPLGEFADREELMNHLRAIPNRDN